MNEEQEAEPFATTLMSQLEGAIYRNFDVHDIEVALGNGLGVTRSVIDLSQTTEAAVTRAIHQYLDASPTTLHGVVVVLDISPRLFGSRLYRVLARSVRGRYPNGHFMLVLRNNLQDGAPGRLTIWRR